MASPGVGVGGHRSRVPSPHRPSASHRLEVRRDVLLPRTLEATGVESDPLVGRTCGVLPEQVVGMRDQHFLNTYRNASTPPPPDVPALLASFMLAADPVLAQAAELARVITHAHQGAATQLIGEAVGARSEVLLAVREVRGLGGLSLAREGRRDPRIRTQGQPTAATHRRGAAGSSRVAELRRRGRRSSPDARLAGGPADRI